MKGSVRGYLYQTIRWVAHGVTAFGGLVLAIVLAVAFWFAVHPIPTNEELESRHWSRAEAVWQNVAPNSDSETRLDISLARFDTISSPVDDSLSEVVAQSFDSLRDQKIADSTAALQRRRDRNDSWIDLSDAVPIGTWALLIGLTLQWFRGLARRFLAE